MSSLYNLIDKHVECKERCVGVQHTLLSSKVNSL